MTKLQALLLCDLVVTTPEGKVQLQGLFDVINTFQLPTRHGRMWVFFRFLMEEGDWVEEGKTRTMTLFLQSIPYRFYPILALILVFWVALTGRDFGPMRKAQAKAVKAIKANAQAAYEDLYPIVTVWRNEGQTLQAIADQSPRALNVADPGTVETLSKNRMTG